VFSVDLDVVTLRICLGSEFGDNRAIHNHPTFPNKLFGFPAAGNAGMSQQFL
jgi:hypothetical protein